MKKLSMWEGSPSCGKAFNIAAGFKKVDDRLPQFFAMEKSTATGAVFDIGPLELDEVHNY